MSDVPDGLEAGHADEVPGETPAGDAAEAPVGGAAETPADDAEETTQTLYEPTRQFPPGGLGSPPPGGFPPGGPPWAAGPGSPPWAGAPWGGPWAGVPGAGPWGPGSPWSGAAESAPPGSAPPGSAPPEGVPPADVRGSGPPVWYGWGPWYGFGPWPGGGAPAAPTSLAAGRRRWSTWLAVGGVLGAVALVAIGLGIGYSVWGTGGSAPVRNAIPEPAPGIGPGPRILVPRNAAFLGVLVVSSGTGSSSAPSTTVQGARVVAVVPSSPAARAGIVKGDTIVAFAGHAVRSAVTLRVDVLALAPGDHEKVTWVTPSNRRESATVTLATRPRTRSIG